MSRPTSYHVVHLPFDDLERFLAFDNDIDLFAEQLHITDNGRRRHEHLLTNSTIAHYCNVTLQTVNRWRSTNSVPLHSADRVAIGLNVHPLHIWGLAWFTDLTLEEDHEAASLAAP